MRASSNFISWRRANKFLTDWRRMWRWWRIRLVAVIWLGVSTRCLCLATWTDSRHSMLLRSGIRRREGLGSRLTTEVGIKIRAYLGGKSSTVTNLTPWTVRKNSHSDLLGVSLRIPRSSTSLTGRIRSRLDKSSSYCRDILRITRTKEPITVRNPSPSHSKKSEIDSTHRTTCTSK